MLVHATGRDGMFLIANFVLFFLGFSQMNKEKKHHFYFIFACLVLMPFSLTMVSSIYRASRLMVLLPLASVIFTLGFKSLLEIKNKYFRIITVLFFTTALVFNYADFVRNYWVEYPKLISVDFSPDFNSAFKELKEQAGGSQKIPYVEYNDFKSHRSDMEFFEQVYFPEGLHTWTREVDDFPREGLVLTSISGSGDLKNYKIFPSLQKGQKTFYIVGAHE